MHSYQHSKIQLNSQIYSQDEADFRVSWTNRSWPFLTTPTQKWLNQLLAFQNWHQHAKNQLIPSVHSWDTANFTVPWQDLPHSFLTMPNQKIFDQLLIFVNLYQHAEKYGYFIDSFWRNSWFKNPALWLAESIKRTYFWSIFSPFPQFL